jgi:hypothetical protein
MSRFGRWDSCAVNSSWESNPICGSRGSAARRRRCGIWRRFTEPSLPFWPVETCSIQPAASSSPRRRHTVPRLVTPIAGARRSRVSSTSSESRSWARPMRTSSSRRRLLPALPVHKLASRGMALRICAKWERHSRRGIARSRRRLSAPGEGRSGGQETRWPAGRPGAVSSVGAGVLSWHSRPEPGRVVREGASLGETGADATNWSWVRSTPKTDVLSSKRNAGWGSSL